MSTPVVAPLGGHSLAVLMLQLALLVAMSMALGSLARRAGLPAIVGELTAGVVLGPSLLGSLAPGLARQIFPPGAEQFHMLDAVGQLGVVLLVALTVGELDLGLVRRRAGTAVRVSLPGFLLPMALGIGAGLLLPASVLAKGSDRVVFAFFLGVAMSVTAIPVVAKTLVDMNLMHRNVGQLILMSGTLDDLLGWLCLSVITAMATTGLNPRALFLSLLYLLLFAGFVAALGRRIGRVLLVRLGREDPGRTIAVAVVLTIVLSAVTDLMGFEAILGGVAAGLIIRMAGPQLAGLLAPLCVVVMAVLAPIFFATAGLRMDLTELGRPATLGIALLILVLAVAGKFVGAFVGARLSKLGRYEAIALAAGMNSRGIVELIIAMVGLRLGVISTTIYTVIVLVAMVTSLMGPPILRFAMSRLEVTPEENHRLEYSHSATTV